MLLHPARNSAQPLSESKLRRLTKEIHPLSLKRFRRTPSHQNPFETMDPHSNGNTLMDAWKEIKSTTYCCHVPTWFTNDIL